MRAKAAERESKAWEARDLLPWRFVPQHPRLAFISNIVSTACLFWLIGAIGVRRARFSVFRRYVAPSVKGTDVSFVASDGIRLAGTYWPGAEALAPGLVIVHGIGACRRAVACNAAWFASQRFAVLTVDLRGHGGSASALHTFGWHESFDVHAAFHWLKSRQNNAPIAVLGISMGGAAALLGPVGPVPADALVLQSVFTSFRAALRCRMALVVGSFIASLVEPFLSFQTRWRFGVWPKDIAPLAAISAIRCPILVIGGSNDGFVPVSQTHALHAAASHVERWLWIVPGIRRHEDIADTCSPAYRLKVLRFLQKTILADPPIEDCGLRACRR